uniref:Peroxisomal membrane protein PEX13 n=1 Tax=Panstrongylus lignarius TaxID=156445 RepID=A0A224XS28_9HEMI
MSAPVKPWEASTLRNMQFSPNVGNLPHNVFHRIVARGQGGNQQVPPLPPRPHARNNHVSYGGPLYSGYGMYGYGMPYGGGFGLRGGDYDSRFLQVAEEATNSTFQSIESFVRAFSSITMMLESTYQALHMSFRSVLSVADNMSKLRSVALNIFSSLSILKFLYWLYRRILYMLGLVNTAPLRESAWRAAESQVMGTGLGLVASNAGAVTQQASSWPLLGLFGLMLGAPYILYRVLAPQINSKTPEGWDPSTGIAAQATCNFENPARGEIPFKKGDILIVPSDFRVQHGWTIAKLGTSVGYIPADRVSLYFEREKTPTQKTEEPVDTTNEVPNDI